MSTLAVSRRNYTIVFDLLAVALVYMLPAISHMLQYPLYLFDPMRVVLVIALVHTHRNNALILALTLPMISFLFSGHPVLLKVLLISGELTLNVVLFYQLYRFFQVKFTAILISILLSKIVYYLGKFLLIEFALLDMKLISTNLWFQVATMMLCSVYVALFFRKKEL